MRAAHRTRKRGNVCGERLPCGAGIVGAAGLGEKAGAFGHPRLRAGCRLLHGIHPAERRTELARGDFKLGALHGIERLTGVIASAFPSRGPREDEDELPNRPQVL